MCSLFYLTVKMQPRDVFAGRVRPYCNAPSHIWKLAHSTTVTTHGNVTAGFQYFAEGNFDHPDMVLSACPQIVKRAGFRVLPDLN